MSHKDYKLELRVCICGCLRSWKCLPTSKDAFYSQKECPENLEQRNKKRKRERLEYGKRVKKTAMN